MEKNHSHLTELIMEHRTALYGFILTLVSDVHAAEDIFQETWVVIFEKWDTYNPQYSFRSWAFGIARNKARQYWRKSSRSKTVLTDPEIIEQIADSPVWDEDPLEEKEALRLCLKKLSGKIQKMFHMRYFEGSALPAIAKQLGWNVRSISVAMTRARNTLMDCIDAKLGRPGNEIA